MCRSHTGIRGRVTGTGTNQSDDLKDPEGDEDERKDHDGQMIRVGRLS